jgi:hypothetical protein
MRDANGIPRGLYCYDEQGLCPHWSKDKTRETQENGHCKFLKLGDWDIPGGLLWDQCKECGENMGRESK